MPKPSPTTTIRNLRRQVAELQVLSSELGKQRDSYRVRATKAEQDVAEWKRRFDALLERTPTLPAGGGA